MDERPTSASRDYWTSCGYRHLKVGADGRLTVTDAFLRGYLLRPELAPLPESCDAEVALHDGLLSLLTFHAQAWWAGGKAPTRIGNAHPSIVPYQTFPTADGWMNVGVGNEGQWKRFQIVSHHEVGPQARSAALTGCEDNVVQMRVVLDDRECRWLDDVRKVSVGELSAERTNRRRGEHHVANLPKPDQKNP